MSFGFGFGFPRRLTSGGGLSPSLYLDFVGTNSLPSTVTFSRGTNATLTDSNGRVVYAPHNLLTNSESFEAAAWVNNGGTVTANALVAPDGSTTADYLVRSTAAADGRYQTITAGTSGIVTASVYIKKDTASNSYFWLYDSTAAATRMGATITWSGTTPIVSVDTGTGATPQDAGNGWWRIVVTSTALTGANTNRLYLLPAYTASSNGQQTAFWGAQLNVGALQSYNSTTPKNLLGFTQEPENAAWTKSNSYVQQNLLTWSQDFDNAVWVKSAGASVTANSTIAPDGTLTADTVTFAASSDFINQQILSYSAVNGQSVTFSIYARTATQLIDSARARAASGYRADGYADRVGAGAWADAVCHLGCAVSQPNDRVPVRRGVGPSLGSRGGILGDAHDAELYSRDLPRLRWHLD